MSAPAPEPPALPRSPEEGQHSSHEPGHILTQLSAALESPLINALEWSEDGQGVLVHTELYEEEMGKNKELFPELADLGCVAVLQACLLAYGFKLQEEKVNSQVLLLQHPHFQRVHPTAEELGALRSDAGLSAKQKKKKKKKEKKTTKRRVGILHPSRGAMSHNTLGQQLRRRALYQYINFDVLELMYPSEEDDEVQELAQPSQVPEAPGSTTALQLEDTWAGSASEIPAADDNSMQVDIDNMLRHAAHLVPLLFPQYK